MDLTNRQTTQLRWNHPSFIYISPGNLRGLYQSRRDLSKRNSFVQYRERIEMDPDTEIISRKTEIPDRISAEIHSEFNSKEKSQSKKAKFPVFIITVSIVQALFFYFGGDYSLVLRYDPYRLHEIWRFVTAMFVHGSEFHLWGNLVVQIVFGVVLERQIYWERIGLIYIAGILGGSLACTLLLHLPPKSYAIGASAGVYALLSTLCATILIKWDDNLDYKNCRLFLSHVACIFWLFPNIKTVFGENMEICQMISETGHFGGAVAGLVVAIVVLHSLGGGPWKLVFKLCVRTYIVLILTIILTTSTFKATQSLIQTTENLLPDTVKVYISNWEFVSPVYFLGRYT